MPIACDPQVRRLVVLPRDQKLPPQRQARFFFRYLTCRQRRDYLQLGRLDDQTFSTKDPEAIAAERLAALATVLVGWENLRTPPTQDHPDGEAIAFDPANLAALEEVLTESELWELYHSGGSDLDHTDRDFLESRQPSSPEESANPASPAAAVETA